MSILVGYLLAAGVLLLVFLVFFKLVRIVSEQEAWVIEQLGKYQKTLGPGLHLVVPLLQKVAYKHTVKEEVIDVPPQVCITKDNVQVSVDGILYVRVIDPERASYGIDDYRFATAQLAQTTMRSEIGKIELDRSFSERDAINDAVVKSVDEASDPWGIKVTRYEIRDITPTETVLEAMEQQVRAEREKRAEILQSEGEREARINLSKGERQEAINVSKGERQRTINESDGRAEAIAAIAEATADGIKDVADALRLPKGREAMALRLADQFVEQLGTILGTATTSVLPHDLSRLRAIFDGIVRPKEQSPAPSRHSGSRPESRGGGGSGTGDTGDTGGGGGGTDSGSGGGGSGTRGARGKFDAISEDFDRIAGEPRNGGSA